MSSEEECSHPVRIMGPGGSMICETCREQLNYYLAKPTSSREVKLRMLRPAELRQALEDAEDDG